MSARKPASLEQARARRAAKLKEVRRKQSAVLVALIAGTLLLSAALVYLYNSSLWNIEQVEVVGNARVARKEVIRSLRIPPNLSLLKFDSALYGRRVALLPWVEKVRFSRRLPSTLVVEIDERRPIFSLERKGSFFVVDSHGFVLKVDAAETSGLPRLERLKTPKLRTGTMLRSPAFQNAVSVVSKMGRSLREKLVWVSAPSVARLSVWTTDEVELVIGKGTSVVYKMRVASKIISSSRKKVLYIDLTYPKVPVVREVEAGPR